VSPEAEMEDEGNGRADVHDEPTDEGAAQAPIEIVNQRLQAAGEEILRQAQERPYATVLVAVAAGCAIGLVTPKWLTNVAWTVGSRVAMAKVVAALADAA
jgi:hypothetical protein